MSQTVCCYTISEIAWRNKSAGYFFFDADSKRFFRSRIAPGVFHHGAKEIYNIFITSEKYSDDSHRWYTVRHMRENGSIENLSKFQAYYSLDSARRAVRRFIQKDQPFIQDND